MRRWIGRWVMGVGAVHNAAGLYFFADVLLEIVRAGVLNAVDMDPMRNLAFWFLFSGFLLILVGYLVDRMELLGRDRIPSAVGTWFAALTVLGVVTMPASGFWLMIPPVMACLRRASVNATPAGVPAAG